jgi:hypothetical protein
MHSALPDARAGQLRPRLLGNEECPHFGDFKELENDNC